MERTASGSRRTYSLNAPILLGDVGTQKSWPLQKLNVNVGTHSVGTPSDATASYIAARRSVRRSLRSGFPKEIPE